jgi:hypothetical protein
MNPSLLQTTLAFSLFAGLAVIAPGIALQRLLRLRLDVSLVVPLGLAFSACAYWVALLIGLPWLFVPLVLLVDLGIIWPRESWRLAVGPSLRGALAPAVVLVLLFGLTNYRLNRFLPSGEFLLDPCERVDTAYHVGLTWELVAGYPPQAPGLSGVTLGYHLGSYLVRAAAVRFAGIHPYDALSRFDLTLWAFALVLALRRAAHVMGAPARAQALAGWIPLLSDFSFLLIFVRGSEWWGARLYGNLLEDIFFSNAMVPAFAMALGALGAWHRFRSGEGRGYLILALFLSAAVPTFKVFLAAPFAAGLVVTALLDRQSRRTALSLAAPCIVVAAALALGRGGETVSLFVSPLAVTNRVRVAFGLAPLAGLALLGWALVWVLASLGLRVFGLAAACRALRGDAPVRVMGAMALFGWPASLSVTLTADAARNNEALYFIEQAGPLLWLFSLPVLLHFVQRARRPLLLCALLACVCLPTTVEYVVRKSLATPETIPRKVVETMRSLARASHPGDVVIMRPYSPYPPPPVVLAGRRVPITGYFPYRQQFAPAALVTERDVLVRRFFRARDPASALAIARQLGARFVYLSGAQRVDFDARGVLEPVFELDGERIQRILDPQDSQATAGRDLRAR